MAILLMIALLVLLVAVWPAWPYSDKWGYYPSGGLGFAIVIVLILALRGTL